MSLETLHVLYGDIPAGTLVYDRKNDDISLVYDEAWQLCAELMD